MCLNTLWPRERIAKLKRRGPIRAYKVVRKDDNLLQPPSQWVSHGQYKTRYQVNAVKGPNPRNIKPRYERAFHVFETLRGAESLYKPTELTRIIPCLVWDIVAAGKQSGCNVIVARKMILLTDY